jgi:SAM-dependent methyltransferase
LSSLPWVTCSLGTAADLPEESFDLVHVHYVLHALPRGQRGAAVQDLAARLRAGGRLLVREPLYYGSLDVRELRQLAERTGLSLFWGPERHWWLAGPVVELSFRKQT